MKKLLLILAFLLPFSAQAAIAGTWTATSTDRGYIKPNLINGNNPWLVVNSTGTSTFANGISISNGCFAVNGVCISGAGGGVSSVSGTYPILSSGGATPIISIAFGTTTSNTWGGTQTFTNAPILTAVTSGTVNTGPTGILYSTATSSFTPSAEFTVGGTIGSLVGGANSTLTLATNGVGLTKLAQIAANSILGNITSATGNVTAFATSSLGIAISDTRGTLGVTRGGTGLTSVTTGDLHYGSGANTLSNLAIGTGGQVLGVCAGVPCWVATSTGSGSGTVGSGLFGQHPYYAANGTTLTATSSLTIGVPGSPIANFVTATSTISSALIVGGSHGYLGIYGDGGVPPPYGVFPDEDLIDAGGSANDFRAINVYNAGSGSCAQSGFIANGDIPNLNNNYLSLMFKNTGWTGSGCLIDPVGAPFVMPFDASLYLPTGGFNITLATTTATKESFNVNTTNTAGTMRTSFTVLNNGNVGAGTSTPTAILSVDTDSGTPSKSLLRLANLGQTVEDHATSTVTKIGIGGRASTTIGSTLTVIGDGATQPFSVATSTGTGNGSFAIDVKGHIVTSGQAPTCDANCTLVAGNDNAFRVRLGTTITASTVTFAQTFGLAPICLANEGDAGTVVVHASSTPSTVVLTTASALTAKDVDVLCQGIIAP